MSGRQSLTWDRLGRLLRGERSLDGRAYVSQGSYDALGRAYQATYPDGEVVTYSYGANGLLSGMSSSLGDSYLSGVEYNELNLPKRYLLGGTSPVSHSYYGLDYQSPGNPFGTLRTIQWPEASGSLVDRTMSYDPVGNVTFVNDLANEESIAYSYDDLDRLLSASAPVSETYAYNQIGNLLSKNGHALTYGDPAHVHAVTAFGPSAYGYDANGCMVTRASQVVRYDPERRPVRVDDNGATLWRATYDGDGARRKRLDGKGTIHYVGPYERSVGNGQDVTEVVTKYYTASMGGMSRLVAMRKNGVLAYVGTDHLGGTIRITDGSFSPLDGMRYTPYGVDRDPGTHLNTDHKFTSQIQDQSIGLYWYASRAYDPALGRFVSADTIVPSAGNPQTLNRYSYANNNPLRYTDPTGHEGWDDLDQDTRDLFIGTYGEADAASIWQQQDDANRAAANGGGGDGGSSSPPASNPEPSYPQPAQPSASDGQSLAGQGQDVQQLFQAVYGDNAAAAWAQQHEASLASSGNGDSNGSSSSSPASAGTGGTNNAWQGVVETVVQIVPEAVHYSLERAGADEAPIRPAAYVHNVLDSPVRGGFGLTAATQYVDDTLFGPNLTSTQKAERMVIAGGVALVAAVVAPELIMGAALAVGLTSVGTLTMSAGTLAVMWGADVVVKPALFQVFGLNY